MLNYGWVYPQALLVFTITLMYSVVSPLILVFGAIYFGMGCEYEFGFVVSRMDISPPSLWEEQKRR